MQPRRLDLSFPVRGYELDRTGAVPPVVVLRYLENVRWEGLRHGGVLSDMFAKGRRIVVRQQRLHMLARIGYPETLHTGLWLDRVGRTSVEMGHDLRRADGTLVAKATLIAVQLDASWRPIEVSEDIRALATGEGRPDARPVLAQAPPPGAHVVSFHVRPHEIDMLQHVNHSFYAEYFDDARLLAAAADIYEGVQGAGGSAREVHVDYAASALPGDTLRVATWTLDAQARQLAFSLSRDEGPPLSTGVIVV